MNTPKGGHLIFTYGTLKRGLPNHTLMQSLISSNDAVYIGPRTTLPKLPLIVGPYGVPYLINLPGSGPHRVRGELYSVSDAGLSKLDELEGLSVGHYERLPVRVVGDVAEDDEDVEAYFAHRRFGEEMWGKRGVGFEMEAYNEDEAGRYVGRDFRPTGADFLRAIRLFIDDAMSP